jgi:hypothetical protein
MPTFRVPFAIALGAVGFWLVLVATEPLGPGLDPDTVSYVSAARSLVHSGTLQVPDDSWESPDSTTPLAHFPPGFSAAIAVPVALGMPPVQGGRLVVAAAALVTIALAVWLVSESVGWMAGAAAAITLVVTSAIAAVHENVLSEPLFLALLLATLALMTRDPERPRPVLAGIAAAGASLVRYAGVAAIGAVVLWWLGPPRNWRRGIREAALAALPGIVAQGLWVARTVHASTGESIRHVGVYGQLGPTLREGGATLATWLAPTLEGAWGVIVAVIVAAGIAVAIAGAARRAEGDARASSARRILAALAVMAATYLAVIFVSRLFADPDIPLDGRLLAPFMVLAEIAAIVSLAVTWRARRVRGLWRHAARALVAAAVIAWWGASLSSTIDDVQYALETGNDYADIQWSGSRLIAWVREHGDGHPLFTNFPTALYFHADRMARMLPQSVAPDTVRAFADTLARRGGWIVAFERSSEYAERPDALLRRLPVREIARFSDGGVWVTDSSAAGRAAGRDVAK